jgi:hypothetical protein
MVITILLFSLARVVLGLLGCVFGEAFFLSACRMMLLLGCCRVLLSLTDGYFTGGLLSHAMTQHCFSHFSAEKGNIWLQLWAVMSNVGDFLSFL